METDSSLDNMGDMNWKLAGIVCLQKKAMQGRKKSQLNFGIFIIQEFQVVFTVPSFVGNPVGQVLEIDQFLL